jgi:hypothetical protein
MTADPRRETLAAALKASTAGHANFVIRGDALADGEVTEFDLTSDLAGRVVTDLQHAAEGLLRKQFVAYDPSYQTNASQVLVEDLAEIPELAALDARVRVGDVGEDRGGADVVAMVHAFGVGDTQIVGYRTGGAGIATRRRQGLPLMAREGVYGPVPGDVLYYEPRFDVFTCADFAYFTNASLIQTKLQAPDKARALARETLRHVTTRVRIDGFDELEKAVMDDPTLRAKMAYVARLVERDPEYAALLTTERLVEFIRDNPQFDIPVSSVDGVPALKFETSPQHRHQIPRLLADDYLFSQLTERSYEAGSKLRVGGS